MEEKRVEMTINKEKAPAEVPALPEKKRYPLQKSLRKQYVEKKVKDISEMSTPEVLEYVCNKATATILYFIERGSDSMALEAAKIVFNKVLPDKLEIKRLNMNIALPEVEKALIALREGRQKAKEAECLDYVI